MKPSICLNMIVKNEGVRIERCLRSVLPFVKSVAVYDTGSTDDTISAIYRLCAEANVPAHVEIGEFGNFSQARNAAFALAKRENGKTLPWCSFVLLMDADMELVVENPAAFDGLMANAASYDMMQKGGCISYANRRILNLQVAKPPYVGVTHEYIDVPADGMIDGATFLDHADGINRKDKYVRDAALLTAALKDDPDNARSLYYLGNTYRDGGDPEEAIRVYDKRIALGGWDEETHSAMMNRAFCYRDAGNEALFLQGMLAAHNFRPRRAEPLYELAKFYREKGNHAASLLFSKAGVNIKRPNDLLFVNDFVYSHGLRYEYSVEGYYDEKERSSALQVTDDLALDPTCSHAERWSARSNLYWYTKPLSEYCSSFKSKQIAFTPPDGYTAMNPSVEVCNGHISINVRCVNYKINEHGQYMIGEKGCGDAPIDTRNFVCKTDDDFNIVKSREIVWARPDAVFPLVTGLEDVRLWRYYGAQWFSATVREQDPGGLCQMVHGKLTLDAADKYMFVDGWKVISDGNDHQKNWMPVPSSPGSPRYMYRLDTVVIPDGFKREAETNPLKIQVSDISGSSQLIPFKSGYIAVVHEASNGPDGKRTYWHRFAWFDKNLALHRLSLPFVFLDKQIEFCAGLAYHPNGNDLIITFGVRDAEAHAATVSIEEVAMMCWKFHEG